MFFFFLSLSLSCSLCVIPTTLLSTVFIFFLSLLSPSSSSLYCLHLTSLSIYLIFLHSIVSISHPTFLLLLPLLSFHLHLTIILFSSLLIPFFILSFFLIEIKPNLTIKVFIFTIQKGLNWLKKRLSKRWTWLSLNIGRCQSQSSSAFSKINLLIATGSHFFFFFFFVWSVLWLAFTFSISSCQLLWILQWNFKDFLNYLPINIQFYVITNTYFYPFFYSHFIFFFLGFALILKFILITIITS